MFNLSCRRPSYVYDVIFGMPVGILALSFLFSSCAQQGTLTGGPKDEKPPEILSSEPANFSTMFISDRLEINFNEYFALKDINKQLVVSPPMPKKPEFKIKGKSLEVIFSDSLQPDRTYAINFGDAIVDLNEGNPIKNYQFVFSTGASIDSLQVSGQVTLAIDNKPAEDVLVMLYHGTSDSLPLKTIPLYISRTNKEGRFTLKNLAGGSYKIFALKDGNSNFLFDQLTEPIAFIDSLITPEVTEAPIIDTIPLSKDSAGIAIDSVKMDRDTISPARDTANHAIHFPDTLPEKPKYLYKPENIELRLFTEAKPSQYLASADRIRKDQIRLKFNEKIDSLNFEFLDLPADSVAISLEWLGDPDTLDFWIMNNSIALRDSITAILDFPVYNSVERRVLKTDTVKLRYRAVAKPPGSAKNEFSISVSVEKSKTLEYGSPLIFTTSLPYTHLDTSLIRLVSGKDSLIRPLDFKLTPDTLKGLVMNKIPVIQVHPRIIRLDAGFVADTSYRLTLLPGAFIGIAGQKNDSLDIRFKMKSKDKYGAIKIALPDLKGPAIVEIVDARSKVAATRYLNGPGTAFFELLEPGKYTARLIFDTNNNRRWDTGRYLLHIQPERVKAFDKEMNLKANWEVSETWNWEDL